jgi:hypothetical protein
MIPEMAVVRVPRSGTKRTPKIFVNQEVLSATLGPGIGDRAYGARAANISLILYVFARAKPVTEVPPETETLGVH